MIIPRGIPHAHPAPVVQLKIGNNSIFPEALRLHKTADDKRRHIPWGICFLIRCCHPAAELPELATATVVRVSDRDPAFLRYLDALGIRPGSVVTVTLREPFDGPITVKVGKTKQVLGSGAAARVYIEQKSALKSRKPVVGGKKRQ